MKKAKLFINITAAQQQKSFSSKEDYYNSDDTLNITRASSIQKFHVYMETPGKLLNCLKAIKPVIFTCIISPKINMVAQEITVT